MSISIEDLLFKSQNLNEVLELWSIYSNGRRDSYATVADRNEADIAANKLDEIEARWRKLGTE